MARNNGMGREGHRGKWRFVTEGKSGGRSCELFPAVFRRPVRWRREREVAQVEGKVERGREVLMMRRGGEERKGKGAVFMTGAVMVVTGRRRGRREWWEAAAD
ncbi:hypothetical protein HAX54_048677 [Datura stramonium]|uniref:Uncharacterized protein n=1 Tax=Datura stramonium TaxID=4076 RepID=A0ABS8STZ8_DATST|nr:hypothetical protein [Datura stramonium]